MAKSRVLVPDSGHFHAVRFYEDAASLARMVAGFLAEGFIAGQPGIVIATPEHRHAVTRQLLIMGFNLDELKSQRQLLVLDANETLATFMVDGMPSARRFQEVMLPVIDAACSDRTDCVVRAYGEMVDLLWKDGKEAAAIRLEMLWNQLARSRRFSLVCGYSMGSFYKDAAVHDICHQHTHMVAAGGATAPVGPATPRVSPIH
jgi:hypothetical protein